MRGALLVGLLALACQESAGPASAGFDVDVQLISFVGGSGACYVTWNPRATDSSRVVTFTLYERNHTPSLSEVLITQGQFTWDRVEQFWLYGDIENLGVRWLVSAGGFSEDKFIDFSCGASWHEP